MDQIQIEPKEPKTKTSVIEEEGMLWEYIKKACTGGETAKILFIAITSQVEGKVKSEGIPYGQGKSIFSGILGADILEAYDSFLGLDPYESMKENMGYTWEQHIEAVEKSNDRRRLVHVMDDLQRIAGKSKSRDPYVQSWAEFFTTARPFFGVVIFTCPSIGDLAKCFRELVNFEIKIPYEGYYEVQFLKSYSDYSRPLEPLKSMKYKGENVIPRAPASFVKWYITWRKESSFDTFLERIKKHGQKKQKEPRATTDDIYRNLRSMGHNITQKEVRTAARVPHIKNTEEAPP